MAFEYEVKDGSGRTLGTFTSKARATAFMKEKRAEGIRTTVRTSEASPRAKSEPKPKAATGPKAKPKAKAATGPKAKPKAKAATGPKAKPKAKEAAESEAQPKAIGWRPNPRDGLYKKLGAWAIAEDATPGTERFERLEFELDITNGELFFYILSIEGDPRGGYHLGISVTESGRRWNLDPRHPAGAWRHSDPEFGEQRNRTEWILINDLVERCVLAHLITPINQGDGPSKEARA